MTLVWTFCNKILYVDNVPVYWPNSYIKITMFEFQSFVIIFRKCVRETLICKQITVFIKTLLSVDNHLKRNIRANMGDKYTKLKFQLIYLNQLWPTVLMNHSLVVYLKNGVVRLHSMEFASDKRTYRLNRKKTRYTPELKKHTVLHKHKVFHAIK